MTGVSSQRPRPGSERRIWTNIHTASASITGGHTQFSRGQGVVAGGEGQQREAGGAHRGRGDGCPALGLVRVAAVSAAMSAQPSPNPMQHRAGDDALGGAGEDDRG